MTENPETSTPRLETTGPIERPYIVSAQGTDITGEIDLASSEEVDASLAEHERRRGV